MLEHPPHESGVAVCLQVILNSARVLFVKHRHGYIFPVYSNTNVVDGCFFAAMQKVETTDEYIWFYSDSFTVAAASRGALNLLGVCRPCYAV